MITRRMFVGALAGVCLKREHLVLEAIAAEKMPHRLIVSGVARSEFFELRDYGATPVSGIFRRCVLEQDGKFLFAFDSLQERELYWREVSADPKWIGMREQAAVREIAIYRALSSAC